MNEADLPEGGPPKPEALRLGHEPDDLNVRGIAAFAAGLGILGLVIHLVLWGVFRWLENREAREKASEFPLAAENQAPPSLREAIDEKAGVRRPAGGDEAGLDRYTWADRDKELVQPPMEVVLRQLENRLPARASAPARPGSARAADASSGRSPQSPGGRP
jgi:hypothetical protein